MAPAAPAITSTPQADRRAETQEKPPPGASAYISPDPEFYKEPP